MHIAKKRYMASKPQARLPSRRGKVVLTLTLTLGIWSTTRRSRLQERHVSQYYGKSHRNENLGKIVIVRNQERNKQSLVLLCCASYHCPIKHRNHTSCARLGVSLSLPLFHNNSKTEVPTRRTTGTPQVNMTHMRELPIPVREKTKTALEVI